MNAQIHNDEFRHARGDGDGLDPSYQANAGSEYGTVGSQASTGQLLKRLLHEGSALLTNEVALAKSEARDTMRSTKKGVAAVASGGAVALAGLVVLLMAAVYGLSNVMEPWLAALIVGGVVTFIGLAMMQSGKKKFGAESLKPDHTLHSLRKDKEAIRGRTP